MADTNSSTSPTTSTGGTFDRETVSKFNPFVSTLNSAETVAFVAKAITDLGYMLSCAAKDGITETETLVYQFTNALGAALEFESGEMRKEKSSA